MATITDPSEMIANVKLEVGVPLDDVFVLNVSQLNHDKLAWLGGELDESFQWVEVFCDSSEIDINRALNMNGGVFGQAEASELNATIHNPAIDPFINDRIAPNRPVRIRVLVDEEWATLFVGTLRASVTRYSKDRDPAVTLTAYDDIQRLNNIQETRLSSESFSTRLTALAAVAGISITVTGGTVTLAPKESYASIWDIMNIAANSEGGFIYANREGALEARGRSAEPGANVIEFSDNHGAFDDHFSDAFQVANPLHACYKDIDVVYDTKNVINSLTVTNISEADAEGNDIEEAVGVWLETTSINNYGESNLPLLTNLTTLEAVESLKDYVFDNFAEPAKKVQSITYSPQAYWQTTIDIGDYVHIDFHNVSGAPVVSDDFMVTSVAHSISPDGWDITLELWKGGA